MIYDFMQLYNPDRKNKDIKALTKLYSKEKFADKKLRRLPKNATKQKIKEHQAKIKLKLQIQRNESKMQHHTKL